MGRSLVLSPSSPRAQPQPEHRTQVSKATLIRMCSDPGTKHAIMNTNKAISTMRLTFPKSRLAIQQPEVVYHASSCDCHAHCSKKALRTLAIIVLKMAVTANWYSSLLGSVRARGAVVDVSPVPTSTLIPITANPVVHVSLLTRNALQGLPMAEPIPGHRSIELIPPSLSKRLEFPSVDASSTAPNVVRPRNGVPSGPARKDLAIVAKPPRSRARLSLYAPPLKTVFFSQNQSHHNPSPLPQPTTSIPLPPSTPS